MTIALPLALSIAAVAFALLSSVSLAMIALVLIVALVAIDSLLHRPRSEVLLRDKITVDLSRRRP